ncbi:MAG TPA: serine hydrolase [Steroidobacteraceae bacterium]|nr:serine hydrolase [Steroidobacteraceae bacterium]
MIKTPFVKLVFAYIALFAAAVASASSRTEVKKLIARGEQTRSAAVLLLRDGKQVGEYRDGDVGSQSIDLRSATQSLVALGLGALLREGQLESLDTPVYRFYPEWNQGRKRLVTIRMLLNQTSGLHDDASVTATPPDVVRFALAAELMSNPGDAFAQSDAAADLLMGIVGKAAGIPADEYIEREVFTPLGVQSASWRRDEAGNPLGSTGLTFTADDAAKIGQLVLDGGKWLDRQIVPESFIDEMLNPQTNKSVEYGLLWMRTPAWIRLSVDAASIELIRKLGLQPDAVENVSRLQGKSFDSSESLVSALHHILSDDEFEAFYAAAQERSIWMGTIFHLELGPMAAFSASGEGNYIVVVPDARLVAVRLAVQANDEYDDFVERVLDVAKSWHPALKKR